MATILLVDDDPAMLDILTLLLEAEGIQVTGAVDGEEAYQKFQTAMPDLVVTDVMLPKIDGWKLCQKIKTDPDAKHVPVLVVTAKGEQISELMSYESGADAYISKPFRNDDFIKQVKDLLGQKA